MTSFAVGSKCFAGCDLLFFVLLSNWSFPVHRETWLAMMYCLLFGVLGFTSWAWCLLDELRGYLLIPVSFTCSTSCPPTPVEYIIKSILVIYYNLLSVSRLNYRSDLLFGSVRSLVVSSLSYHFLYCFALSSALPSHAASVTHHCCQFCASTYY